LEPPP